jgi:2-oxoglutarate ferredoxin oxidoreductase subunit beta
VATGIRLANHGLHVIITGGDGDGYGIGVGHFVHAMRRNLNLTYVVMNNGVYGLTTGQTSPTTELGMKTKSSPDGAIEPPINPISLALVSGATYVARAFSGDPAHMGQLIADGIKHEGFSLIDIFSPCVTFNKLNSYDYYRERVYKLDQSGHDVKNMEAAIRKSYEWGTKIPIGLFYQNRIPTYEEREPVLKAGPLISQKPVTLDPEVALREFY